VTIAIARPERGEAAELAALHIACWREAYRDIVPEEQLARADLEKRSAVWERAIADPERIVLATYETGAPVGFMLAGAPTETLFEGIDGHVSALYVAASHYRLGLGRRLMAGAAAQWLARGGKSLALGVLAANHRARSFYEGMGGRLVSEGIYQWDGHDLPDAVYVFDDLAALAERTRLA